ncbi:MAG: transglycosylase SLT domain-containing protein [Bacteroidales bacterium]|jgi:membrane-bound lytic murein transglycosylase F|nr:transglycosylase SLT domain-containing protein [Bacteroidales bacterium]
MGTKQRLILLFGVFVALLCIAMILSKPKKINEPAVVSALQAILDRGYIRVGIVPNTNDYYIENGTVKGFHYELTELFAHDMGLNTTYSVYDTYWDNFIALLTGEVDLLAMDISSAFYHDVFFLYTEPHSYSPRVLVQRKENLLVDKNGQWISPKDSLADHAFLLTLPFLSVFYQDALTLSRNLPSGVRLTLKESFLVGRYSDMLQNKEADMFIDYEKNVRSNSRLNRNLDYSVRLTDTQPLHWLVNKNNIALQTLVDTYLDSFKKTNDYSVLINKYYAPNAQKRREIVRRQRGSEDVFISDYDHLIRKHAQKNKLDWRFVAAVIYQESRFNPDAVGGGGASGLMQLMPHHTSDSMDTLSVEDNIAKGCELLHKLAVYYWNAGVKDSVDLYRFVLAAYNGGHCHVDDARLLAKKKGFDPNKWEDVNKMTGKLSDRKYIGKIKLQCGLYRGKRLQNYVFNVWKLYQHYQNMTN